jgi:hypothetical protein
MGISNDDISSEEHFENSKNSIGSHFYLMPSSLVSFPLSGKNNSKGFFYGYRLFSKFEWAEAAPAWGQ